jgi:Lon protease-like protein
MFPLGQPLIPTGVLPLYLFEERYLRLYEHVAAEDGRFGVVLIERGTESRDDNATFAIGCVARLIGAASNEDGSISIVTAGTERFRIVQWLDPDPYPKAVVDLLSEGHVADEFTFLLAEAVERFPRLIALQSELYVGTSPVVPEFPDDPVLATYQLANSLGLQAIDAQRVLEAETANERVTVVSDLLDDAIELTRLQLGIA